MLFNSVHFFLFFPVVTVLFFALPHKYRWAWLLLASGYFYASLIPKYLLVLIGLIAIDYTAALWIENAQGTRRKTYLYVSLFANLALLFFFKYFDFFSINTAALASFVGWNYSPQLLGLVLPLGISFHTFQSMSYTIEVYRGNVKPERHLGRYALFVMFYPQLVAGPIERPQQLLCQLREKQYFDYDRVVAGLSLMGWGLLKKVVLADSFAQIANPVFNDVHAYQGSPFIIAALAFTFQIYFDFSGYSDIARGAAQVMGFRLSENFNQPYLSPNIGAFWRRWHISLSAWFRDYLYFALGGARTGLLRQCVNLMVVFLVSGLWHGANWTFVIWGALHGGYLIVYTLWARWKPAPAQVTFGKRVASTLFTFLLVSLAWIFFRANSLADALYMIGHLFSETWTASTATGGLGVARSALAWILMILVLIAEANKGGAKWLLSTRVPWFRWVSFAVLALIILNFGIADEIPFIYFQF